MRADDIVGRPIISTFAEKVALAAYSTVFVAQMLIFTFIMPIIGMPNRLLGILALALFLVSLSGPIVLAWKVGKEAKLRYWYLKYVGFWMMVAAYVVFACVGAMLVVFQMITPLPSFLPKMFVDYLLLVAVGVVIFMMVGAAVWFIQAGLKAWANLNRWLETAETQDDE